MKDLIRKGILVAVGITVLTKEKAEKIVKDMVKHGDVKQKEGKALVQKLVKQSMSEQKRIQKELGGEFRKSADAIALVTKSEIKRLAGRLKQYQKGMKKPVRKEAAKKKKKK